VGVVVLFWCDGFFSVEMGGLGFGGSVFLWCALFAWFVKVDMNCF